MSDDAVREARDRASHDQQDGRVRIEEALGAGEFVLYFQPKVGLLDGRVVGAEALIRWQHPERGLLAPGQFFHLIEDSDLAAMLGRWVFETAIAQAGEWQRAGLAVAVNVNVAALHLRSPTFAEDVDAALAAHPDVPPATLELEVTETTVLADLDGMAAVIDACRRCGVRFALDDFGSGRMSLADLRGLRVDSLKIDPSLVRNMLGDGDNEAMVEGIIGLGRAFRREVVAVGVETAAHCVALINLGCTLGQGYGIARPMPAEELADWMRRRPSASA